MPSKRELVFVLLLPVGVAAVVWTGGPPLTTADQSDPESLVAEADGSVRNTSIAGVRTERLEQPDGTSTVTVSVREEPPDKSRVTTLETNGVNVSEDQRVINGSTLWTYDEEAEEVEVTRLDGGYFISETYTFSDDELQRRTSSSTRGQKW